MIIEPKNYHRTLPLRNVEFKRDDGKYWVLIWFGKLTFKDEFQRKLYVIESSSDDCKKRNWNFENIVECEIPEEKTLLFTLGSIFDINGRLLQASDDQRSVGLYSISDVWISNKYYKYKGLFSMLKKYEYPLYGGNELAYNGAAYIQGFTKVKRKRTFIIIPIYTIIRALFYRNQDVVTNLLYDRNLSGIKSCNLDGETATINYDGHEITADSAASIGRYFFTHDSQGERSLNELMNNHLKKFLNSQKQNKQEFFGAEMKCKLPVDLRMKVSLQGTYWSKNDLEDQIFVAGTMVLNEVESESSNKTFFVFKKLILNNLNDKQSSDKKNEKELVENTNSKYPIPNTQIDEEPSYLSPNRNLPIYEMETTKIPFNTDGLDYEITSREDQHKQYKTAMWENPFEKIKLTDRHKDHDPSSNYRRLNDSVFDLFSEFKVFNAVLDKFEEEGCVVNNLVMQTNDGTYSSLPISIRGIKKVRLIELIFSGHHYCIVEPGRGNNIIILRHREDSSIGFIKEEDSELIKVLEHAALDWDFQWSGKSNSLNKISPLMMLMPTDHVISKGGVQLSIEERIEKLYRILSKKIKEDIKAYNL